MNKKVMVVTPIYSTPENERFTQMLQAMYWTQKQSYPDFTHVIVDDGSTDETYHKLERIAFDHKNIILFHQENAGQSSAVNFGVDKALSYVNPKYIAVLHSDDMLLPRSLEHRIMIAEGFRAKMVYTDMVYFDGAQNSRVVKAKKHSDFDSMLEYVIRRHSMPYPTILWDRDLFLKIDGYNPSLRSAEDWDIALRSVLQLSREARLPIAENIVTVAYRNHNSCLRRDNVKNGVRASCIKHILRSNLKGKDLYMRLFKEGIKHNFARLPDSIKEPLKKVRDMTIGTSGEVPTEVKNFLYQANRVDYMKHYI